MTTNCGIYGHSHMLKILVIISILVVALAFGYKCAEVITKLEKEAKILELEVRKDELRVKKLELEERIIHQKAERSLWLYNRDVEETNQMKQRQNHEM